MSHWRLHRAIKSQRATAQLHAASFSRKQTKPTRLDYDILASSSVLVGCLAKRKRTINRRVQKSLDTERFVTVFVKEDRETGKVAQKPCLFTRQSRSVQLDSRSVCEFVARDKVAHSCDKSRTCDIGLSGLCHRRAPCTTTACVQRPTHMHHFYQVLPPSGACHRNSVQIQKLAAVAILLMDRKTNFRSIIVL